MTRYQPPGGVRPVAAGLITQLSDTGLHYTIRAMQMANTLGGLLSHLDEPTALVVESPTNWFNERGQKSKDNEAVQKLYWQVGAICSVATVIPNVRCVYTREPSWKGQTPKHLMVARAVSWCTEHDLAVDPDMAHDTAEALLLGRLSGSKWMTNPGGGNPLPSDWSCVYDPEMWSGTKVQCHSYFDQRL